MLSSPKRLISVEPLDLLRKKDFDNNLAVEMERENLEKSSPLSLKKNKQASNGKLSSRKS